MQRVKHDLRYGGSVMDSREFHALVKSASASITSGNWQAGEEAKLLEQECADFLGVKYGVLTTSGSCAGLLALSALELPRGSEVIISAVTFPTIFNIILQCNLVPVVVDAKIGSYTFDVKEVEQAITPNTKAIIAIHPVGNPVDMVALMKVAKKHKLYVIEDNCDGWGSSIGGKKVGAFGDISITSFHAAHIVSMGVGGGIFTSNKRLAENVRVLRDWGRQANINKAENKKWKTLPGDYNPRFIYEKIGYNFQILELQAAVGRVQLRKLKDIMKARQKNFEYLTTRLSKFQDLIMPKVIKDADVCWFALPLTTTKARGPLLRHLEKHGIETRPMFAGNIARHPAYKDVHFKMFGPKQWEADYIMNQSFWITVHPRLAKSDLDYIVETFKSHAGIA